MKKSFESWNGSIQFLKHIKTCAVRKNEKVYSEPWQMSKTMSKMEFFAKNVENLRPLSIFAKSLILVCQGSEYAFRVAYFVCFCFCVRFHKQNCNLVQWKVSFKYLTVTFSYLNCLKHVIETQENFFEAEIL